MSTICLNMIVKNESEIIEQTLENLCQHINFSYWVIADTGSTDNTAEIIENFFNKKGIPGELVHHTWENFSHNRNKALEACSGKSDYVFIFDADDYIEGNLSIPSSLNVDSYNLRLTTQSRSVTFHRPMLFKNNGNFYWRGVVHEYLETRNSDIVTYNIGGEYFVVACTRGDRNKNPTQKYLNDGNLLENAILNNVDPDLLPRYTFYCAQCYRDAEANDKAIYWYEKRSDITEGWSDERYLSCIELGFLYEEKKDIMKAISYWHKALNIDSGRAEAWYHLARRYHLDGQYEIAYFYAKRSLESGTNLTNRLFVNKAVYDYLRYYEFCYSAFFSNRVRESYEVFKTILDHVPRFILEKLHVQITIYKYFIREESTEIANKIIDTIKEKGLTDLANELENI